MQKFCNDPEYKKNWSGGQVFKKDNIHEWSKMLTNPGIVYNIKFLNGP